MNKKHPFQRFVLLRAAGRMVVLAWIFVAVLALATPEYRVSAENSDSLPKWKEVIDKLTEETAWTSIDGKTNYMADMMSSDMELYQDTYNLGTIVAQADYIKFIESRYPIIGEGTGKCLIEFGLDEAGMVDYVAFDLQRDIEKIKKMKLRTQFCTGLYPDLCGIRLGDRYEEVCQILGIEEEMLNGLPDNFSDASSDSQHIETISWDEYSVYGITYSEDGREGLYFVKGEKLIILGFRRQEDAPVDKTDLFLQHIDLKKQLAW